MSDVNLAGPAAAEGTGEAAVHGLRFSLFGIPVSLEPSFVLVLGVFGFIGGGDLGSAVVWVVLGAISILVHEAGHAFAYRAFGIAPRIRLVGFGGLTYGGELSPGRSVVVSAAGPLSGLALGAIIWILTLTVFRPTTFDAAWLIVIALFMNIGWSLFNLLPILPLDGSHIVAAILRRFVPSRAGLISIGLSLATSVVIVVAAISIGEIYIAGFVLLLALGSLQALGTLKDQPRGGEVLAGWERLGRGDPDAAVAAGRAIADAKAPKEVSFQALELIAWAELARDDRAAAMAAFERLGNGIVGRELLRRTFGVLNGDIAHGLAAGLAGWRSPVVLGIAMRAVVDAGRLPEVLGEARSLDRWERAEALFLIAVGLREAGHADLSAEVRAEVSAVEVAGLARDPAFEMLRAQAAEAAAG